MYPWYQGLSANYELPEDDRHGIQQMYGKSLSLATLILVNTWSFNVQYLNALISARMTKRILLYAELYKEKYLYIYLSILNWYSIWVGIEVTETVGIKMILKYDDENNIVKDMNLWI